MLAVALSLLCLGACGGRTATPQDTPDAAAADAAEARAASEPQIVGEPWTVAHNPDLGALTSPEQEPVDFGVWQAADGSWQLWSCIRNTKEPGTSRLFYRWEAARLTDSDWKPMGIAMHADTALGELEGGLQAPFVLRVGDTWHMLYGDWDHICHATSSDGKTFTRVLGPSGKTALFSEGYPLNTRDPMLVREDGAYRIYYTTALGAVYMRSSSDLAMFSAAQRVAYGGSAGKGWSSAECPFVVRPEEQGPYFLFRTQAYGESAETSVYRSDSATDFGIDDDRYFVKRLPIAAPELIQADGAWFIAYLRSDLQGIQIARLSWQAAPAP